MKQQQSGFTLIELIAVIVVLGILAAVAVPKMVDFSDAAKRAAVDSVAANLSSASALNHAADIANKSGIEGAPTPTPISNCNSIANLMDGGLPTDYTIRELGLSGSIPSRDCTVTNSADDNFSATFTGHYVAAPTP